MENIYRQKPEDINFLLELCRVFLRKFKDNNEEIPVSLEQLKRLRSIDQSYTKFQDNEWGVNSELDK
ncbi:MAG: hypothetical protein ACXAEX_11600 [Promethearchaeota archaeon]